MTEKLPPISKMQLGTLKHRAVLKMVEQLQKAYEEASERYGMTRAEFAHRIDMSPSQFSRILNGKQNISIEMAEAMLRSMEARAILGHEFLEDLPVAPSNRSSHRYHKRGIEIDSPDYIDAPYKVSMAE